MEGTLKKLNSAGFGFIETPEKIDFFLHWTKFDGDWKALLAKFVKGELLIVEFEIDPDGHRGPTAMKVKLKDSYRSVSESG